MRKPISPLLTYLLIWITFSVYWFYWAFKMMAEINRLYKRPIYRIGIIGLAVSVWATIFAVLLLDCHSAMSNHRITDCQIALMGILLGMSILWTIAAALLHTDFGRRIGHLQQQLGCGEYATSKQALRLFFRSFMVVPYLQTHYIQLTERLSETEESPK